MIADDMIGRVVVTRRGYLIGDMRLERPKVEEGDRRRRLPIFDLQSIK